MFEGLPVEDNFYFNNLDWSCHDMLAVGCRSKAVVVWRSTDHHQQSDDSNSNLNHTNADVAVGGTGRENARRRSTRMAVMHAGVTSLRWDPTGERLTVGMKDGRAVLCSMETGKVVSEGGRGDGESNGEGEVLIAPCYLVDCSER